MKKSEMIIKMTANTINNDLVSSDFSLMRYIPNVLRARGFRLYLDNNKRLIDLWLNGGAAVLGHTPVNLLREIKNTASRGLYAPYPHFSQGRLIKALLKIFPGYSFRLYAAPPPELTKLFQSGAAKFWRPYIDPNSPLTVGNSPILIPVIPGIQTWRDGLPFGLCAAAAKNENQLLNFPESDNLSPILLAAAARGIYDLLASSQRVKPDFPRVIKALKNSIWKKQGIYITLKEDVISYNNWTILFNKFFEIGFLLPPVPAYPLILPGEMSDGEEAKLAAALVFTV